MLESLKEGLSGDLDSLIQAVLCVNGANRTTGSVEYVSKYGAIYIAHYDV